MSEMQAGQKPTETYCLASRANSHTENGATGFNGKEFTTHNHKEYRYHYWIGGFVGRGSWWPTQEDIWLIYPLGQLLNRSRSSFQFRPHRIDDRGMIQHILGPAALPLATTTPLSLSVLSYNVLLPNSIDGWWNYKMYLPPLTADKLHVSSWGYRRTLIKDRIAIVGS